MTAVEIGPLVFALDRFAAILAGVVFTILAEVIARRHDRSLTGWAGWAIPVFVVAARAGHVGLNLHGFATDPWRVLAVWQGGFSWQAGLAGVAIWGLIGRRGWPARALAATPVVAGAFAAFLVIGLSSPYSAPPLPRHDFPLLSGGTMVPAAQAGQPMVINLWATWCPPCRREMPMMTQTAAAHPEALFIFANQGEGAAKVQAHLDQHGLSPRHVLLDLFGRLSQHYSTRGLPVTLFIDRSGAVAHFHMGEISGETLNRHIDTITAEPTS